jgi:hypothetical protein
VRKRGGRDQQRERPDRLHVRPILAQVAAGYRYDWKLLLGAGLLVFVPIGLLTALDPLDGNALDEWNGGWSVAFVLLLVAQASIPLLGAVFYSGVVAAGEEQRRHGDRHDLREVARNLPYWTLILADLALLFVMAVGFIALVIPGFIVITWFALIAPVIEMEGRGVRGAFRRSRAMVRPHFWKVAGIVIPLTFLQALLERGGDAAGHALLGDGYPGNLLGSIVSNFLGSPLYALTVLALYFEITERED